MRSIILTLVVVLACVVSFTEYSNFTEMILWVYVLIHTGSEIYDKIISKKKWIDYTNR